MQSPKPEPTITDYKKALFIATALLFLVAVALTWTVIELHTFRQIKEGSYITQAQCEIQKQQMLSTDLGITLNISGDNGSNT